LPETLPFRPQQLQVPAPDGAARAEGFAAGYAAGAREAARRASDAARARAATAAVVDERRAAEHARLVAALDAAADAVRAAHAPVLAAVDEQLHAAALELARAVLGVELAEGDHAARAALARVLGVPHLPARLTVRLHPDDVAALVAAGTALPDGVDLAGDASLARGDAVAQYADGVLDARLAAALARAEAALRGEVDA